MVKEAEMLSKEHLWVKSDNMEICKIHPKEGEMDAQYDTIELKKHDKELQDLLEKEEFKQF